MYARAQRNVGAEPYSVAGDRGHATRTIYEHNTLRGVASVFPYRRRNGSSPKQAEATTEWDEHGIPLCRHCGRGSDFVRFAVDGSRARLWFQCALPQTEACQRVQTISCAKDWTRLLPLWRTEESYAAIRETHGEYERAHHLQRVRYLVGPDSLANRPKRIGIGCQQLRSSAAMFLEWLRICVRQGWIGRAGRHVTGYPHRDRGMLVSLARRREKLGRTGGARHTSSSRVKSRGHPPPASSPPSDDSTPF